MSLTSQKGKSLDTISSVKDEKILVVRKEQLFPYGVPHGLQSVDIDGYEQLILNEGKFLSRSSVEEDSNFKQIIPYLVFTHKDKYFLMQRKSTASESRLRCKYSLGIGGHIRKEDLINKDISKWADREFCEEVSFKGNYTIEPIGLLNDESDRVGEVHTGFVFLVRGDSDNIQVRSELKNGTLLTIAECAYFYPKMEQWSQRVFDYLKQKIKRSHELL